MTAIQAAEAPATRDERRADLRRRGAISALQDIHNNQVEKISILAAGFDFSTISHNYAQVSDSFQERRNGLQLMNNSGPTTPSNSLADRIQAMDHSLPVEVLAFLLCCCPTRLYDCTRSGPIGCTVVRLGIKVTQ